MLVSFPPLSYMLKFSGCSCLISGRDIDMVSGLAETRPKPGRSPATTASKGLPRVVAKTPSTVCAQSNATPKTTSDRKGEPYYHAALVCAPAHVWRLASAPGATQPQSSGCDKARILPAMLCSKQSVKTHGGEWETPLKQTCSDEYTRAQYAFKGLMIH